jgi:hypothetical protein
LPPAARLNPIEALAIMRGGGRPVEPLVEVPGMKPVIGEVDAVLKAAGEWVSAQEALVVIGQLSLQSDAEREAVDVAGVRLVVAVRRWQRAIRAISGRPNACPRASDKAGRGVAKLRPP